MVSCFGFHPLYPIRGRISGKKEGKKGRTRNPAFSKSEK
jgi:hypothetical protein